ncbi:MAG: MHS family MFS transporter [Sphingomonadales bacterium]|nr:MHS family MFS transporter [Sphingomonadales bacterium]PIX64912.1 MAG: MFS transporter [Sphingomonadales bacterium CG_4_10_14_3_um_filter_58_15]NCO48548.1 MHS family MFS transporter [Sphingomonadales bacterium]NCO99864.1 MHS family MFS transporter [Sphingomonadales bacterium]NCP25751.1 MHS family MFS transporter [Sphingomonadales bacterium]
MASEVAMAGQREPTQKEIRLVIAASSAGTIFEWYDFFIYATLAGFVGVAFFPSENTTLQTLLVWAGLAVGFGFRPLGAILFGYLGDRLGRKYTFLVTVTLMGIATAGIGLIPSAEAIGIAAPIIVISFRILQGLALGGEYGGAAIYVSEHSPVEKRGYYTSFIQASVVGGFVLSIAVVLSCRYLIPAEQFAAWGWRVPFLLSLILLAISLWMRLKLSESPVFQAMKAAGTTAKNPFVESLTYPGNPKRIFVAMFGITAGLTTIWYTAFFSSLSFLKGPMRVDDTTAEIMIGIGGFLSMGCYLLVGKWSDRVGRKKPIIWGNIIILITLFPAFWMMGNLANPSLSAAQDTAPVVISGPGCQYDPFADQQTTECGRLIEDLTAIGISYDLKDAPALTLTAGATDLSLADYAWDRPGTARRGQLEALLTSAGYDFSEQYPSLPTMIGVVAILLFLGFLSAMNYGSVAALLAEMFPAKIRYSSMSIPYHIGAGYFGGFLPLIAGYIIARTGDAYSGLWYTWIFVFIALVVGWWGIPDDPEAALDEAS